MSFEFAAADKRLLFREAVRSGPFSAEVWALSPSTATQALTLREIGLELEPGKPKRRPVATTPNQRSVALLVL